MKKRAKLNRRLVGRKKGQLRQEQGDKGKREERKVQRDGEEKRGERKEVMKWL